MVLAAHSNTVLVLNADDSDVRCSWRSGGGFDRRQKRQAMALDADGNPVFYMPEKSI